MRISRIEQIKHLIPPKFIDRLLFKDLIRDLRKPEIQIIFGPRQVGKSSLMYFLMDYVFKKDLDLFYFNLDSYSQVFDSPELFITDINSKKLTSGETYIFIDEIQRKKDAGLFLKYIYDQKPNFKILVTGSSSLNIKNMVNEPLTGRKFEYFLHPLSLVEILQYNGIQVAKLDRLTPDASKIIEDYLIFGGYPDVILANLKKDKISKLQEIAKSYLTRDLTETFNISKPYQLETTAIYLAQNIANLLSKENIAKTLSISVYQVENYLEALEKSFIISFLRPFYKNPVKEVSHRPKVYFEDNGIRNALIGRLDDSLISLDKGKLFEQTVFQLLNQKYSTVKFWRNTNQTEVDFIIEKEGKLLALETKYNQGKVILPRNLKSFAQIYKKQVVETKVISKQNLLGYI